MSNRQARINRLKAAFQKVEQLMKEGYVVQWDGDTVVSLNWTEGLCFGHEDDRLYTVTVMYEHDNSGFEDFADLPIDEINKELSERLTVWKRVEVKL